jgi:CubicO group peptidase (beta-lactamase class C family)
VPAWELGAYAPAGCLRGTARGTLALAAACLRPPAAMEDAVALALTPRAGRGPVRAGLGWMYSPLAGGTEHWWHNGGTHGSRSFTAFVPATGAAIAVLTNSPKAPDAFARRQLAR